MMKRQLGLASLMAVLAASAVGQTGTVPLDNGTPPSGMTNSNITVSNGNVGIGTTNPQVPLDIAGTQMQIYDPSQSIANYSYIKTSARTLNMQTLTLGTTYGYSTPVDALSIFNGQVGIGTATPQAPLNIAGTQIQIFDPSQAQANYSYIKTTARSFNTQTLTLGTTYGYSTPVDALSIWNGNVGIGTTAPAATLDVAGTIHATGAINASGGITFPDGSTQTAAFNPTLCGGDYAESVDVSGDRTRYQPGDVLVIDPQTPGRFLKSAEAYSSSVTGIYSTKPGLVGRRQTTAKSPDEVPMAMIGIVPTKVSTENGSINPGDLLVTASAPGYAMKGTDRSKMLGAVIGKALGSLDSGTGIIEVVVTLQ